MKHVLMISLLSVIFSAAAAASQAPVAETKTNYAVVNLKNTNGVTEGESELITDRLRSELFNTGKVNVMERGQMQEILKEQGFQQSGACTDEACLVEMGQMLGVKVLVVGSLGKLGSMFLVNVRSIDVQTAQIIKVVSIDIKGNIEEVVGRLREIAEKLAGSAAVQVAAPIAAEPPPPAAAKTTPAPDTVKTDAPTEETQVDVKEEKPVVDTKTDRNRNRGGIGLSLTLLPGKYRHSYTSNGKEYTDAILLTFDSTNRKGIKEGENYRLTWTPLMDFAVRFKIRAGSSFTIDVGPHMLYGSESFESVSSLEMLDLTYMSFGAQVGLNFVKRLFPIKINAGIFVDFTVPILSYEFTEPNIYSFYDESASTSTGDASIAFKVIPGARAGAEIMASPRIGFSFDFVFQWLSLNAEFDFDEMDLNNEDFYEDFTQTIGLPLFGIGMGVNFYF